MDNMEIIRIRLPLSNAYLIKDKKTILVDSGAPHQADRLLAAVQKAGVTPQDLALILHTHGHFDHAGSTAELKRRLRIPSAVHVNDAFMLRKGINGEIKPRNFEARLIKALVPNSFEPSEPDILLEEEMTLTDFGVDGKIIFTPGHTTGSISVLFNTEAIIGDALMGGWAGGALFGSRPNYHYYIDDLDQLHGSLQRIMSYKLSKLYVGHGGPLTTADVRARFSKVLSM
jgi:glyoxylase-like metal-dependent hydrolase (beta-lactamase superfamily II)